MAARDQEGRQGRSCCPAVIKWPQRRGDPGSPGDAERALVRGINMVKRHQKQSGAAGGRHHFQGSCPVHMSNIALADPKDGKPTRIGFKTIGKGDEQKLKVRVAKRSGVEIDG